MGGVPQIAMKPGSVRILSCIDTSAPKEGYQSNNLFVFSFFFFPTSVVLMASFFEGIHLKKNGWF